MSDPLSLWLEKRIACKTAPLSISWPSDSAHSESIWSIRTGQTQRKMSSEGNRHLLGYFELCSQLQGTYTAFQ